MPETAFTPGPWMRDGITVTVERPAGEPRKTICIAHPDVSLSAHQSCERMKANARLCAAAPELYEALNLMASNFAGHLNDADHDRVYAALAKARGEPAPTPRTAVLAVKE